MLQLNTYLIYCTFNSICSLDWQSDVVVASVYTYGVRAKGEQRRCMEYLPAQTRAAEHSSFHLVLASPADNCRPNSLATVEIQLSCESWKICRKVACSCVYFGSIQKLVVREQKQRAAFLPLSTPLFNSSDAGLVSVSVRGSSLDKIAIVLDSRPTKIATLFANQWMSTSPPHSLFAFHLTCRPANLSNRPKDLLIQMHRRYLK